MNNPFDGSNFRGFNTEKLVPTRRGGYNPGTIGVSQFQGRMLNYARPGQNSLRPGAGVSVMTRIPRQMTVMTPEQYNIYRKDTPTQAQLFGNLYK